MMRYIRLIVIFLSGLFPPIKSQFENGSRAVFYSSLPWVVWGTVTFIGTLTDPLLGQTKPPLPQVKRNTVHHFLLCRLARPGTQNKICFCFLFVLGFQSAPMVLVKCLQFGFFVLCE